jgi:hypothetical protein
MAPPLKDYILLSRYISSYNLSILSTDISKKGIDLSYFFLLFSKIEKGML